MPTFSGGLKRSHLMPVFSMGPAADANLSPAGTLQGIGLSQAPPGSKPHNAHLSSRENGRDSELAAPEGFRIYLRGVVILGPQAQPLGRLSEDVLPQKPRLLPPHICCFLADGPYL